MEAFYREQEAELAQTPCWRRSPAEQLQEQRLAPLTTRQRRELLTLLDIIAKHDLGSATASPGTTQTTDRAAAKPD